MEPIWDRLAGMGIRTVIGAASWAQVEPVEGTFDFSTVDAQIEAARARGLRLVLIWFGAFKNAASTYAPGWVRGDVRPIPPGGRHRHETRPCSPIPAPCPSRCCRCSPPTCSRPTGGRSSGSWSTWRRPIRSTSWSWSRSRTRWACCATAATGRPRPRRRGEAPVPQALIDHLVEHQSELRPELADLWARQGNRESGTWSEVFGDDWQADEVFMAWAFASYCGALAAAGKAAKALPMYANAWLGPQPGQPQAGDYPSGGPVGRVIDVWKAAAPSLDLVAPDIYVDDVKPVLRDYARPDNPLFVPESRCRHRPDVLGARSPPSARLLGVRRRRRPPRQPARPRLRPARRDGGRRHGGPGRGADRRRPAGGRRDRAARSRSAATTIVARNARALLGQMLLDAGVGEPPPPPPPPSETEGSPHGPTPADARPFGLVIAEAEDQFLLVGQGVGLDFSRGTDLVEVDSVEEGRFESGRWVPGTRPQRRRAAVPPPVRRHSAPCGSDCSTSRPRQQRT